MVELTHRNTRRYGGYIVHVGIVIMFVGFTGSAFNKDTTVELPQGEIDARSGAYTLQRGRIRSGRERELSAGAARRSRVTKNGEDLGMMVPEQRFYIASKTADVTRSPSGGG